MTQRNIVKPRYSRRFMHCVRNLVMGKDRLLSSPLVLAPFHQPLCCPLTAKYGTYTMVDQLSDKIVDFQIVQVSEVTSSNAMEREGFKRCMETIHDQGANVKVVATVRHVSIRSDMKKNFPHVHHQFDVWHVAKSVTKKLTEKAKRKECSELFGGVQTLVRGRRICYVRSGSPLSTTQPTSTHGTVLTCIMNVPTHPSLGRRQGQSSGFALVPLHMRLLRRLCLTKPSLRTLSN